ncbi:dihydrodipicolinate synthase family protein [Shimwellia blattae]|uniref:Putative dihydrodipicolinate synthase n=1 Tax=Shimwellia blattae (strain ATCC 29907 / DSM 4481 / JCM 1650 / NBRC 105725 / CDC 9005-74) TaxID=630626 RepID=I2BCY7_SHIBC|nr:dihydrodipicolinate synthase family protein [Shimwellia blattae]AFJ48391.1 putative dihydrodipicolinate synthase [Shimwellia blattae DSM 4481 = NBRC 105725]GAB81085.1 putative dihydrodipicolinate synthase [Shimwellia blattae DSM 4481 = NBRC 105725]VDY65884.1 Dihydrodipicolinate synthase [Shimwellia blattae]VEC26149.1 Dihydrodipicolinate synthase [Shimwellia blattae]
MTRRYNACHIAGVNPIAALPFTTSGDIDQISMVQLLEHLAGTGVQGLTLFGIASEFPKLSDPERARLAQLFVSTLSGADVYRVLSVTEHCTELAVQRAREYARLGADALMLLPPFFLHPSQEAIAAHITAVLEAVDIPVLVQYAPGETGIPLPAQQLADVAGRYPHAVFKIENTSPVEYTREFLALAPDAGVMNGYAGIFMPDMLTAGGKGVMPGCSFSEVYVAIYRLWVAGETTQARQLHQRLLPFIRPWMSHCEYIIQVEKTILYRRGIIASDYCRRPGWALSDDDHQQIAHLMETFDLAPAR